MPVSRSFPGLSLLAPEASVTLRAVLAAKALAAKFRPKMRLIGKYWSFSRRERIIVIEAGLCLACARLFLLIPFRWIAPFLGRAQPAATARPIEALAAEQRGEAVGIRRALLRVSRHLPWHSSCLVCAIAGRMMLRRRRMPSVLLLGARNASETQLAAHAWLQCGEVDVIGAEAAPEYAPIVAFRA